MTLYIKDKKEKEQVLAAYSDLMGGLIRFKYYCPSEALKREGEDKRKRERSEMAASLVSCVTGRDEYEIAARAVKLADAMIAELKK